MARWLSWVMPVLMLVVACGKNDAVRPVGAFPYQAPPPPGYQPGYFPGGNYGGGYPVGGGYPMGGPQMPQMAPMFQPQMPAQMPPQYYPFLPVDQYMRSTPQTQQYWQQFWSQWQQYAGYRGYSQYDFPRFWFEFTPSRWQGGASLDIYVYLNQSFYYWVTPQTQFQYQGVDPNAFWANCNYYPYIDISWGGCGSNGYCY